MSKNKFLLVILLTILVTAVGFFVISKKDNGLISPVFKQSAGKQVVPTPAPTPAPPSAPKEFKFGPSTDLKQELESINPQVLDSDFQE